MAVAHIFGQVLRTIREQHGLSQEQLGLESGYHRTYISMLERGQKTPTLTTILQLASVLNISAAELVRQVENQLQEEVDTDVLSDG